MSKILEGAKEARAVARGEIPAASITMNGHRYVPYEEFKQVVAERSTQDAWGTLGMAICIAAEAHIGQTDKAGRPYIEHAIRVMHRCSPDPIIKTVGVLHDVIEDCEDYSIAYFKERGFGDAICEALDAITHRDGEPYAYYLGRVRANPIAREVKLADIADNSDPARLAALPAEQRERLEKKYAAAIRSLSSTEVKP